MFFRRTLLDALLGPLSRDKIRLLFGDVRKAKVRVMMPSFAMEHRLDLVDVPLEF
jgi:hypothetical protein